MLRKLLIYALLSANVAIANDDFIVVQSTTSTLNSGLYDHILPIYNKKSGINVKVVAVGTGQALKNAKQCDGDVLIVHAKNRERAINRMQRALEETIIEGPKTTISYHQKIMENHDFRSGNFDTGFLDNFKFKLK